LSYVSCCNNVTFNC